MLTFFTPSVVTVVKMLLEVITCPVIEVNLMEMGRLTPLDPINEAASQYPLTLEGLTFCQLPPFCFISTLASGTLLLKTSNRNHQLLLPSLILYWILAGEIQVLESAGWLNVVKTAFDLPVPGHGTTV